MYLVSLSLVYHRVMAVKWEALLLGEPQFHQDSWAPMASKVELSKFVEDLSCKVTEMFDPVYMKLGLRIRL